MTYSRLIKSVQSVEITIAISSASNTATISSVNTANTVIFYNGQRATTATYDPSKDGVLVTLTNGTTVTATTLNADTVITRIVCCTVVEFQPGVLKSVQYGTVVASAANTGTSTITSVTTANAFVMKLGAYRDQTTYNLIRDECDVTLTNSTTVTLTRGNSTVGDNITAGFVVVEFKPGYLKSLQKATVATGTGATTGTASISSVTTANCLLAYGGMRQSVLGVSDSRDLGYVQLTNSTTLTATKGQAGTTEIANVSVSVVEFNPGWLNSNQAKVNAIASGAGSQADTITSVDTTLAFPTYLGITDTTGSLAGDTRSYTTIKLTAATTAQGDGGGTPVGVVRNTSYAIIEFLSGRPYMEWMNE